MVVLSASICTRQGKALVSRQFVEMNRLRVEGLLAAFPKLALTGQAQQHTYVETDSVRYVYQPLENQIYLLLITTKASNIVEDLGTLRLLAKVVPDVAGGLMESAINTYAFELIFAFDEVLTAGGYKEEASLSQIRTNLLMDSHEEKIQMALKQAKMDEAKSKADAEIKKIQDRKMAQMRQNLVSGNALSTGSSMPGFGGGGGGPTSAGIFDINGQQQEQQFAVDNVYAQRPAAPSIPSGPKVVAKSGMKLGGGGGGGGLGLGGKKKDSLMAAMAKEDNLFQGMAQNTNALGDLGTTVKPVAAAPSTPLTLLLEEKISVNMNREGTIEGCEVKGTLTLTANTDAGAPAVVVVNKPGTFNFATHPKVDKKIYEKESKLVLKGGKEFPVGRPVGILRWSYNGEDAAPITINCWPEDEGGAINVNIEMELTRTDLVLYDVNILLPLGTTDAPEIAEIDGVYKHDPRNGMMCWHFDQVDANNSSGSLEFKISGSDTDAFFPVQVGFRSEKLLCDIQVLSVTSSSSGADIPNQKTTVFSPDSYQCA